ncbi:zinc finger matrin-type protein CG9776 isoform X3 [Scaptodrosophila lebanonensis]|uniref:Zinc finger matrin-type protein CG9776 isoform X3 n=1 Tax=Drosophila lebanonensis TaxID=7225 RepID=A0A6J2T9E3_DROLE|nr:zinc finger matrin-type protein CG9776 isoform X3 [Scaptodrosophila lebanonensis]
MFISRGTEKKKKKRKHGKKQKKAANAAANDTSSSSDGSSSDDEQPQPKKLPDEEAVLQLLEKQANASILVAMRKQETPVTKEEPVIQYPVAPPPPPIIKDSLSTHTRLSKWTPAGGVEPAIRAAADLEEQKKRDEAMMQQWNTVQPVISESEKKLLEQLKGKLKSKGRDTDDTTNLAPRDTTGPPQSHNEEKSRRVERGRRSRSPVAKRRNSRSRRSSSRGGRDDYDSRRRKRSRSRDRSRGRRRYSRSPLRNRERRSRSRDARRRRSRSRSRSRSGSREHGAVSRVERPVVKHSEFRPRTVPERKGPDSKRDKKESASKSKSSKNSSSSASAAAAAGGKKLPFIGKMPVFKKQPSTQTGTGIYGEMGLPYTNGTEMMAQPPPPPPPDAPGQPATSGAVRPPAPTVVQIQMAMMEDAYGNAPPFHPDAGMMMDYDELMPDPVQFANLMTACPPPPPPGNSAEGPAIGNGKPSLEDGEIDGNEEDDVLPPGIDESESDLSTQPLDVASQPRDGELPKDFAEALDIIFPSERPADEAAESPAPAEPPSTITTIVEDEAVMDEHSLQDLAKQGIHLVTIEETTQTSLPPTNVQPIEKSSKSLNSPMQMDGDSQNDVYNKNSAVHQLQPLSNGNGGDVKEPAEAAATIPISLKHVEAVDIPMPGSPPPPLLSDAKEDAPESNPTKPVSELVDVANIPQPPVSPTGSEKMRRQAELDELAMLGIDSSDMAAQYAL